MVTNSIDLFVLERLRDAGQPVCAFDIAQMMAVRSFPESALMFYTVRRLFAAIDRLETMGMADMTTRMSETPRWVVSAAGAKLLKMVHHRNRPSDEKGTP